MAPTRHRRTLGELRLIREAPFRHPDADAPLPNARSPRDVARFLAPYHDRATTETFWILALNAQHKVLGGAPIVITRGTLTSSLVHAREVFRAAIVAGACAIILAHNHPSGDPTPSPDDREVTERLYAAGQLLELPVLDHIITGVGRYTSFAEAGLL